MIYPTQFELSAVQWIAEKGFVLEPGSADNPNWAELEALLALGKNRDADKATDGTSADATSAEKSSVPEIVDETGRRRPVSLLDVVNWNSRQSSDAGAASLQSRP